MTQQARRRKPVPFSQVMRRVVQATFLLFILVAGIRHNVLEESAGAPSVDAICPFGGLETLWHTITQGTYVPKTHPSNIVLGLGFLIGAVVVGGAFCGWVCPFGTVQDALTSLRGKLRVPELRIPNRVDRWLRYLRFVSLALILYMTISTVKLWFAGYDPYRTLFSLGWIFEFNLAANWPAHALTITVLVLSFFVPRFWCRYTCPLGAVQNLLGNASLVRIKRNARTCRGCALCEAPCPVGIEVSKAAPRVSTNCVGCLACVEACPFAGTLEPRVSPGWWGGLRHLVRRHRRSESV